MVCSISLQITTLFPSISLSGYTLPSNSDNLAHNNQTITLRLKVNNTGTGIAKAVSGTPTTTSGISIQGGVSQSFGDIMANGPGYADFSINIPNDSPTQADFSLAVSDQYFHSWTMTFSVPIQYMGPRMGFPHSSFGIIHRILRMGVFLGF